jgi:hypothetical protein
MFRKTEKVILQRCEGHFGAYRHAVTHNMQVGLTEIDDTISSRILYIGVSDIPLLRNDPVKHRGTRRHLEGLQRNILSDNIERLANPISCDASADGIKSFNQAIDIRAAASIINGSVTSSQYTLLQPEPRQQSRTNLENRHGHAGG